MTGKSIMVEETLEEKLSKAVCGPRPANKEIVIEPVDCICADGAPPL
jgi:hypothetical protein